MNLNGEPLVFEHRDYYGKPQLNLVARYGTAGLAGSTRSGEDPFTPANTALYERVNRLSAQQGLPPLSPVKFGDLPDTLIGGYGATLSHQVRVLPTGSPLEVKMKNGDKLKGRLSRLQNLPCQTTL